MQFTKLHEGAGEHRGVAFEFTILEDGGVRFSEMNYTLPNGRVVNVSGSAPYKTCELAVAAVRKHAAAAIDLWLNNKAD